ncbi:conserved hypothetical protein [Ricinus communis]|uniref:Uncharacterized protein n=1 Tax=Ricinus communis TaxID=3988 RepID=B9S3H9_RICCO|nr:conserved hypothetical protein [Ricinus communis]
MAGIEREWRAILVARHVCMIYLSQDQRWRQGGWHMRSYKTLAQGHSSRVPTVKLFLMLSKLLHCLYDRSVWEWSLLEPRVRGPQKEVGRASETQVAAHRKPDCPTGGHGDQ